MSSYSSINIAVELTCFFITIAFIISLFQSKTHKSKLGKRLITMLAVNAGTLLADAIAWGLLPKTRLIVLISTFFSYTLSYIMPPLITYYIYTYLKSRGAPVSKRIVWAMFVVAAIMIGLVILSQFNGCLYYFIEETRFRIGPLEWLNRTYVIAPLVVNIVFLLRYRKYLQRQDTGALLLFLLFPLIGAIADLFTKVMLVYIASTIAFIVLYVSLQVQQQLAAVETENNLRTSIMLSQIQPHFLYNSLTAISVQCENSPQAKNSIVAFSQYLRGNMDSLAQKYPIPFTSELEHTQQYLLLEQMRFGKKLVVEYNLQSTDFMLPSLTLQPIVENAVRHGLHKTKKGGTITITAKKTAQGHEIVVQDNGTGFKPDYLPDDGQSHIGIENVRSRLQSMCGGTLTIESAPGTGTTATIFLPA